MKYLLATYAPVFAGQSPGWLRLTRRHWNDLSAQTKALSGEGFDVTLLTPNFETIDPRTLARETFIDVPLKDQPFDYQPLPSFRTMRKFLSIRGRLIDRVADAAADADVVQLGAGGHPVSLGQVAWEAAAGRKRAFVFASDPFPPLQAALDSGRNPAKRLGKRINLRRFEDFCIRAIDEADLVFSHTPAIAERFKAHWNERCHTFAPSALCDAQLCDAQLCDAQLCDAQPITAPRRAAAAKPLRLLAVGDSLATAGLDHLISAVAQARRLSADVELYLLGNVAESEALTTLLRAENLEPVVHLMGNPPMPAAMDCADVLLASGLIPRPFDTIFFAAARGLPMLGYAGQPPGDQLSVAGGALVVPRGEQRLLAQAILDLSRDRDRIVRLSVAARTWAAASTLDAVHRQRAKLVKGLLSV